MDTSIVLKIGVAIFAPVVIFSAFIIGWLQSGRRLKARKQDLQDRGALWSLGLETCLSGLPGLEQPVQVSCGGNTKELIFVADDDKRELCRIPWSSILDIFGGTKEEIQSRLHVTDTLPSLVLAQTDHSRRNRRRQYVPSYLVIDWTDGASRGQQAIFEYQFRNPNFSALLVRSLSLYKTEADKGWS